MFSDSSLIPLDKYVFNTEVCPITSCSCKPSDTITGAPPSRVQTIHSHINSGVLELLLRMYLAYFIIQIQNPLVRVGST